MIYRDHAYAEEQATGEQDETDLGKGNELPVKAHFRRSENRWLYERRAGQPSVRLIDLELVFTKSVRRFCELNAPTPAELAYIMAEGLAFVECNPERIADVLDQDAEIRAKWASDKDRIAKFAAALVKIADLTAELQMEYGYETTRRVVASIAMSLHEMSPSIRAIGNFGPKPAEPTSTNDPEPTEDARQPFDITGKAFAGIFDDIERVAEDSRKRCDAAKFDSGCAVETVSDTTADEVNIAAQTSPEPTVCRWCEGCRMFHVVRD